MAEITLLTPGRINSGENRLYPKLLIALKPAENFPNFLPAFQSSSERLTRRGRQYQPTYQSLTLTILQISDPLKMRSTVLVQTIMRTKENESS